jgi:type VI protein secretion system component Hcp
VIGFLEIPGLTGPSVDEQYKGQFPVFTFSQSVTSPSNGSGVAVKPSFSDLSVSIDAGDGATQLHANLVSNAILPGAKVHLFPHGRASGHGSELLDVQLTDARETLVDVTSESDLGHRTTLSFTFPKIQWTYTPIKADGSLDASIVGTWDVSQSTGSSSGAPSTLAYVVSFDGASAATTGYTLATRFEESVISPASLNPGKPDFSDPTVQNLVDRSVVSHLLGLASNAIVKNAVVRLTGRDQTGTPIDVLRYDFDNVQITSVQLVAAPDGTLQETLGFGFSKVTWTSNGQVYAYDRATGSAG